MVRQALLANQQAKRLGLKLMVNIDNNKVFIYPASDNVKNKKELLVTLDNFSKAIIWLEGYEAGLSWWYTNKRDKL